MSTKNRPRAALIAVLGVIIAAVAFASPANATDGSQGSAVAQPAATVSDQTPAAGGSVKFCGSGFTPGETVTIALGNGTSFPSVTADSSGAFCTTLVLGISLSGPQTITGTGATSGAKASVSIVVGGAATGTGTGNDALANTGAVVISIGALGVLLVVGGSMLVLAGRRRKVNA